MSPVQIQKILFATDFSEYSEKAREQACYLANKLGANIFVLHAIEPIPSVEIEDFEIRQWYRLLEKDLARKLDQEVEFFKQESVDASGELIWGSAWETIVKFAKDSAVDLIVIGSHGVRTREGRFLLGTTSHKVALASSIPVLITRSEQGAEPPEVEEE